MKSIGNLIGNPCIAKFTILRNSQEIGLKYVCDFCFFALKINLFKCRCFTRPYVSPVSVFAYRKKFATKLNAKPSIYVTNP